MRYLPLTDDDRALMARAIGWGDAEGAFADVAGKVDTPLLAPGLSEIEAERLLRGLAGQNINTSATAHFIGCGAWRRHIPALVDNVMLRPEFLTAYTPYQPEIAQGTLQRIYEFQTQVAELTGMEVANASMYDGATACAEAAIMARGARGRGRALLAGGLHPHWRATLETSFDALGWEVEALPPVPGLPLAGLAQRLDSDVACVVYQNPDVFGSVADWRGLTKAAREVGAWLVATFADPLALGFVRPPGEADADIAAGEGQGIGVPLAFGGPSLGLLATRSRYVRKMPGRLCGETTDADGRRAFTLTLVAREQHIRREKATSNICTDSGLCALGFSAHMTLLGSAGLARLARWNHERGLRLAGLLGEVAPVLTPTMFNEFTLRLPMNAEAVVEALAGENILAGAPGGRLWPGWEEGANLLIVAATEMNTDEEMARYARALKKVVS